MLLIAFFHLGVIFVLHEKMYALSLQYTFHRRYVWVGSVLPQYSLCVVFLSKTINPSGFYRWVYIQNRLTTNYLNLIFYSHRITNFNIWLVFSIFILIKYKPEGRWSVGIDWLLSHLLMRNTFWPIILFRLTCEFWGTWSSWSSCPDRTGFGYIRMLFSIGGTQDVITFFLIRYLLLYHRNSWMSFVFPRFLYLILGRSP